ncbi:MAG: tyrosine-type recombinase/integrase [Planctomycetia bacterium]|nr:tyrosine-type recombinase/integrase [Planctomycetia bacterium]
MAWLELRGNTYRINFWHGGRHFSRSLKTGDETKATATKLRVEESLSDLERGRLKLPAGADLITFLISDGTLTERPQMPVPPPAPPPPMTLAELRDRYLHTHSNGAMEENSLATVRLHLGHFIKTLGVKFQIDTLAFSHLQAHIDRRAKKKGHHQRPISPTTLRKEMASFRACWNWGVHANLVKGSFPNRGLTYPKADEKPPFQTWQEIERQISHGGLSNAEQRALWDCLFLSLTEINDLLTHVKQHAHHGFLYPMFCFAAYTGARRSEMLRAKLSDLDLEAKTALLHEKKRAKGRRTSRRVPLSDFLVGVLRDWLTVHPGGQYLFCHELQVVRSKTKRTEHGALTRNEANDHFKRTVADSKWDRLRGWHVFRHSFASNCAAKGIDQRLIDAWLGHQTEEMRRRYRHCFPDQQQLAIQLVFGNGTNGQQS